MAFSAVELFVPDHGQKSVPLYAVTAAATLSWMENQPEPVKRWLVAQGFKGEVQRLVLLPGADGALAGAVLGLGKDEDLLAFATFSERLPPGDYRVVHAPVRFTPSRIALGWALGAYAFKHYKTSGLDTAAPDTKAPDTKATGEKPADKGRRRLVAPEDPGIVDAIRMADATALARDLVNHPANHMGPADLEDTMRALAERFAARLRVIEGDDLLGKNYPLIHAVGAAASPERAPRLLDLVWGDPAAPKVTLVGKGVCFDSGGLDIKSASGMASMKKDMGGAASLIALAQMVMDARLNVRLRLLVPAVENAISGYAYRPGDIFESRKGLTVEIGNTDAEGRLVLADALADADDEAPELLICMATLTGAARTATGFELPPYFTDDEQLSADLVRNAAAEQDPMWRLPLWKGYDSWIDGKVATLTNSTDSPYAGAITAALFLKRFVTRTTGFVHFDIAAWTDRARPGRPVGGEAHAIRALYRILEERFGSKTT